MKFLSYKIDTNPAQGPDAPLDRVKILGAATPALLAVQVNAFIDLLVLTPDHIPTIVSIQYQFPQNNTHGALIHYRLLGEAPYPVL